MLAAATAALMFAVLWAEPTGRLPTAPVSVPVLLDEVSAGTSPPPHWIPKQPGHYTLTDWRRVIDSTWGPGLPTAEKLAIFDLFWNTIDQSFACFNNLTINWDSLRTVYRTEVEDSVSRGRFAAIMMHLAKALRESHTTIADSLVTHTALLPGVPLWVIGGWWYATHFGAALTPLPDSSLLVYRVVENHPLGLERGDVVLGYDRRPWTEILRELQDAQLPIGLSWGWGSCSTAMTHALLIGAGMNWHLFDTIDIAKYSTGDTVHLPTSLLAGQTTRLLGTEQLDIPGVPMPDIDSTPSVTYGVVSGTRIGYIYGWRWKYNCSTEFYNAVNALVSDTTLKGMIIDFRYNTGGNIWLSDNGLQFLFRDPVTTICFSTRSDPGNRFAMKVTQPAQDFVIPGNSIGYDKPIAVLVGPGAVSSGDQVALRMTFHPRVKTFGKSTSAAFNSPTDLNLPTGWYARCAVGEACLASDTTYFLTHREFPVDVPVWHTRSAVARGEDTVVTVAMAWIDSSAAVAEEREPPIACRSPLAATVVRGVLFVSDDRRPGTGDRAALLDIAGRRVMRLKAGANDVRHLAPGVYFCRRTAGSASSAEPSAVRKVILER
jgi:hypothetical protein